MSEQTQTMIACRDDTGEHIEMYLYEPVGGGAVLVQLTCGPVTALAYGEHEVIQKVQLDGAAIGELGGILGWKDGVIEGLTGFFAQEDAVLADLLDRCDAAGIGYAFATTVAGGGACRGSLRTCAA